MKKSFLLFVALFAFVGVSIGQPTGLKAVKKAARALSTYNLDPVSNSDKLDKAMELLKTGFESDEVKTSSTAFLTKGNIYSTIASKTINAAVLKPESASGKDLSLAVQAFDAYKQAYTLAVKKYEKKEAKKGLAKIEGLLENMGIVAFQNKSWQDAYNSFETTLKASDYLVSIGEETSVDAVKREDVLVNAISVGAQPNSGVDYTGMLEKALEMKINKAAIYQMAYNKFEKTDKEKAVKYLNMGREMFPDDPGLLFAEINYYIGEGKLEALIDKLKIAIEKEPENATVYSTLGNVYDQLYGKAADAGEDDKAEDYFVNAKKYYLEATKLDAKSFSSFYGIGALYFNKAAKVGKELNAIGNDFSPAAVKKYDGLKAKMKGLYEESFPFLDSAEKISPNDPLILQALKEYYVRTGDLTKSGEYKAKLEALPKG